jgi:hypothetical protein
LTDDELRTLVIAALDSEPDASFDRVWAHLRVREGRTLDTVETDRLRAVYENELAHPTGAHRIGAIEAAEIASQQPFAVRRTEIVGLAAGLVPLVIHLPSTTPATVSRTTGAVVAGGVYDLAAMAGGFVAVILGVVAARQALHDVSRRPIHLALAGVILLLGVYQSLLGLGLLHQLGLYGSR